MSPGETITYTIEALALGYKVNFKVSDTLPDELEYVSSSANVKTMDRDEPQVVNVSGNTVSVTVEYDDETYMDDQDVLTLTIIAKVKDNVTAGSTITNAAVFDWTDCKEAVTASCSSEVTGNPPAPAPDNPEDTPKDTPVEYDDNPDCGDHFLNFWWLLDIIRTWI